jgi:hypothetical protein
MLRLVFGVCGLLTSASESCSLPRFHGGSTVGLLSTDLLAVHFSTCELRPHRPRGVTGQPCLGEELEACVQRSSQGD